MTRELQVFRHGKSDWSSGASRDFDRPLAGRGRKAVKRMACWLVGHDAVPDRIVSSTAVRAEQSTRRLCRKAGIPPSSVIWVEAIYEAGVGTLLEVLAQVETTQPRVMIVGHNPGFESLVEYLTGESIASSEGSAAFPTAALARLAMPDDWGTLEPGCAELLALVRPRELP